MADVDQQSRFVSGCFQMTHFSVYSVYSVVYKSVKLTTWINKVWINGVNGGVNGVASLRTVMNFFAIQL